MMSRGVIVLTAAAIAAACAGPASDSGAQNTDQDTALHASAGSMSETATPAAPPTTDAEMIASAVSAAPAAVSDAATILAMDESMTPRTLREGSNGWTCMPDVPHTPGTDPMCLDRNGLAWVEAWIARKDPPAGSIGFAYMLAGGSDASNTDPFAMAPTANQAWIDTGPHVMVLGGTQQFAGYPETAENTSVPYVMWADTPYRHLMIPVR